MNTSLNKQFLIAGCLYVGQIMTGYVLGWTAPVLPKLQDLNQTPLDSVITDAQAAWIGSILYLGSISGTWVTGYISSAIGRRPALFVAGLIVILGFLTLALAKQLAVIFIGRVVSGIGSGMMFVTNLIYLGEMSSTSIRGTMLTLTIFFCTSGTLVIYSVGPFVSYSAASWLAIAITGLYLIGIFFIVPESPVYQVLAGKNEEAIDNLISLGRKEDVHDVLATATEKRVSNTAQMKEMFTTKSNRRALFIVTVILSLQQMSGILAVTFFATIIFDMTGSNLEPHISTIIIGVTQVVAGSIAPFLVDRAGRKPLLLFSTAACSVSLSSLGTYFYLYNNDHPAAESLQWLSLTSLILFFIFYYMGFGIVPNTLIGEMFTANVRSFSSSFTVTIGWLVGFGVSAAFGYMVPAWGAEVTFWIYSGSCALAFFFSLFFVSETKGKSLLEIQEMDSK